MVCTENMFREHVPAGTVPRTSMYARDDLLKNHHRNKLVYVTYMRHMQNCVDEALRVGIRDGEDESEQR